MQTTSFATVIAEAGEGCQAEARLQRLCRSHLQTRCRYALRLRAREVSAFFLRGLGGAVAARRSALFPESRPLQEEVLRGALRAACAAF